MESTKRSMGVVAAANVTTIVDQAGRRREFCCLHCPASCKGFLIALRGVEPCHLEFAEAADLVQQLREGPSSKLLAASPFQSGRMFHVTKVRQGRFLLAFDFEGRCDFLIAGGPVDMLPTGLQGALLSPEQRVQLADVFERELALNTGDLTGKAQARA